MVGSNEEKLDMLGFILTNKHGIWRFHQWSTNLDNITTLQNYYHKNHSPAEYIQKKQNMKKNEETNWNTHSPYLWADTRTSVIARPISILPSFEGDHGIFHGCNASTFSSLGLEKRESLIVTNVTLSHSWCDTSRGRWHVVVLELALQVTAIHGSNCRDFHEILVG